jgi:outer membrane protein assembly factor BamB
MHPGSKWTRSRGLLRCSMAVIGCLVLCLAGCGNSETNTASLPPIITFSHPDNTQAADIGYVTAYDSASGQQRWRQTFTNIGDYADLRATSDTAYFLSGPAVTALDLATGKTDWHYQAPEANSSFRSINALAGDTLYATEVVRGHDEDLAAFDAATGALRWRFHASADVRVVADAQTAFVLQIGASSDANSFSVPNAVRAFSAHGNGTPLWTDTKKPLDAGTDLALGSDGTVYLDNDVGLFAIDPATGAVRWHFPNPVSGTQADGGYIGISGTTIFATFNDDLLVALHANDGTALWKTDYVDAADANFARFQCIGANQVVLSWGAMEGINVGVFSTASGQPAWHPDTQIPDFPSSTAYTTCDDRALYVSSGTGISAYRLSDGTSLWQTKTYSALNGDLTTIWHGLLLNSGQRDQHRCGGRAGAECADR